MNKSKPLKAVIAIVALVVLVIGGYVYKDAIHSRIARTAAIVISLLSILKVVIFDKL